MYKQLLNLSIFISLVLQFSCGEEKKTDDKKYTGYMPRFSARIPQNTGVAEAISSNSHLNVLGLESHDSEESMDNFDRIDCSDELSDWNSTPRLPDSSGSDDLIVCPGDGNNCVNFADRSIGYVYNFSTQAKFYDCNARQQLQEDGLTRYCPLRQGASGTGNIGDDDLCEEGDLVDIQLLYSHIVRGPADDWTRFVSWTMNPNIPLTSDVEGILINKYLQSDNLRTKTRVELKRKSGAREVDSILYVTDENDPNFKTITRSYFNEVITNEEVEELIVAGRYFSSGYNKVVVVRAHLKSNVGVVVFHRICALSNGDNGAEKSCDFSSNVSINYFSSDGTASVSAINGLAAVDDSRFSPGSKDITTFFNTSSVDDNIIANHFDPNLFSPANE